MIYHKLLIVKFMIDKIFAMINIFLMESSKGFLFEVKNLAGSLFFGHGCISCGREIPDAYTSRLCEDCIKKLEPICCGALCKKCGDRVDFSCETCKNCRDLKYSFNQNRSMFYYDEYSSNIIKNFKYVGKKFLAETIAKFMCNCEGYFDDVDIITFVPATKKRERERGFNPSKMLAEQISKTTNIKLVSCLCKVVDGKNQAKLNQKERLVNLKDCFALFDSSADEIKGKNVLIVDDVFTTGTTLNECSKALKKAKPKSIKTLTFAKTKHF